MIELAKEAGFIVVDGSITIGRMDVHSEVARLVALVKTKAYENAANLCDSSMYEYEQGYTCANAIRGLKNER